MYKKTLLIALALLLTSAVLAACQTIPAPGAQPPPTNTSTPTPTDTPVPPPAPIITPAVSVNDQTLDGDTVTVAQVVSDGPGWIVIHAQADGKPGPILGFAPVNSGENNDVSVNIDTAKATETLYAMLHVDAGVAGSFEFPDGADGPVKVADKVVTSAFQFTLPATGSEETATVMLGGTDQLGPFLVDAKGMTLYTFGKDGANESACYGGCAAAWPPLTVKVDETPVLAVGVPGELTVISRTDGKSQVAYNSTPLYYFARDKKPGDALGDGLNGLWYVATPSGK